MKRETYYLDTGNGRVYFNTVDNTVLMGGRVTDANAAQLAAFCDLANSVGLKAGKL